MHVFHPISHGDSTLMWHGLYSLANPESPGSGGGIIKPICSIINYWVQGPSGCRYWDIGIKFGTNTKRGNCVLFRILIIRHQTSWGLQTLYLKPATPLQRRLCSIPWNGYRSSDVEPLESLTTTSPWCHGLAAATSYMLLRSFGRWIGVMEFSRLPCRIGTPVYP